MVTWCMSAVTPLKDRASRIEIKIRWAEGTLYRERAEE